MNLLARFFRPPVLIAAGVAGLFSATTLIVFNLFGWSLLLAVLLLITLALVAVILILARQLQAARAAEEIEKTITHQADRDIERSVPGQQAEMESMKEELLAAIDALKKSRMGRRGQGTLSLLPWYLVVGPRDAGKSALLRRSGLQFPLVDENGNPRSVRGVGGTRSLEWWLSEDAVMLDLAGRLVGAGAQFEDNDDWFAFLDVLRKQRKDKPLNGIIVAMPCDQFGERDVAKLEKVGLAVRERVLEVMERLGVRPPVYVVFTKVDCLAGFAEFFGDFDASSRTQPWGATIAPERAIEEDPVAIFDAEFEHLRASLSDRRMARMADVPDPVQRARAFMFPLQLERLRPGMRRFIKTLFQPERQQETALFRGFYLTSAVQQGSPVDRVLQPAAESLGATAPDAPSPPMAADGAYFVHDLLTRVIFGDRALAVTTTREQAARRRKRILVFGGLAVALLGFAILLVTLATINGRLIGEAQRAAQESTSITPQTDLERRVEVLEAMRIPTKQLMDLTRHKPFWRVLAGYPGDPLADPMLHLYTEKLLAAVIAPSFERLEDELSRLTSRNQGAFYDYYVLFRALRLLSKPNLIAPEDATLLARETRRIQEQELQRPSPQERAHIRTLLAEQMAFVAAHPRWLIALKEHYYKIEDPALFDRAAERVRKTWNSSAFYRPMVSEVAEKVTDATLATLIKSPGFLNSKGTVAGPFTREGWDSVRTRIEGWRVQMDRDWVIKEVFENDPPHLDRDLQTTYASEYTAQWVQFMNGVSTTVEPNPIAVGGLLKQAAKSESPILTLLRVIREQTSLGVDDSSAVGAVQVDFAFVRDFSGSGGLTAKGILSIVRKPGRTDERAPKEQRYLDDLKGLQTAVDAIKSPSELPTLCGQGAPARAALEWVRSISVQHSNHTGTGPATRLLTLPIAAFCGAVGSEETRVRVARLNELWGPIRERYQRTLARKYPCAVGTLDATKQDFDDFFRDGSEFWTFVRTNLADIVNEDGSAVQGASIPASDPLRNCLRKAHAIRQSLFAADPSKASLGFSVRLEVRQEGPPVNVRVTTIDLGGTPVRFPVGVSSLKDLRWPGEFADKGATLRVETVQRPPDAVSASGVWGLFRILDRAQVTDGATPTATWRISAGATALVPVLEIHPSSAIHPFKPGLLRFSLPPSIP